MITPTSATERREAELRPDRSIRSKGLLGRDALRALLAVAVLSTLLGCGGDVAPDAAPPATSSTTTSSTPAPASETAAPTTPARTDDLKPRAAQPAAATDEPIVRVPLTGRKTWQEMDDPSQDGWTTEVFAEEAGKQLKALTKLLASPKKIDESSLDSLVTSTFQCQGLYPTDRTTVFEDQTYRVERAEKGRGGEPSAADPHHGAEGMAAALISLTKPYLRAEQITAKFKVYRVEPFDGGFTTHQYLSVSGRTPTGMIESHATWIIRWSKRSKASTPRMQWIGVDAFELTETEHSQGKLLVDCTASILAGTDCYQQQLRRGLNYWIERAQQTRYAFILGTPGIAIGDVNGDGLDDLYLCQPQGIPNRLFLQQPDGSVQEASKEWGVDWTNDSRGVLLFDWDNDGDQDLAVATLGGVALASNDNQKRFQLKTMLTTDDDTMSLATADPDQDGDLDLFVCTYNSPQSSGEAASGMPGASSNFVYHDANDGARNAYFRNDGAGRFEEVTVEAGFDVNNRRFSFAASWEDYDNDGDVDLYVANDYGRDNLYENRGGKFVDVAEGARVEDSASGMSISWGDYDRDGFMDAYVSNMFSSAGNRITFQQQFREDSSPEVRRRLQRFARGNTLLKNRQDSSFQDLSRPAGVEMGRWAWGSRFVDLNNDGWQDLLVANGYVTDDNNGDL